MKRFLLLLLLPLGLFAQQPFGYHATWHYSFSEFGYTGYKKVAHVGDTLMHGMNWLSFSVTGVQELRTGPGPNDLIQDTNATFGKLFLATRNDSVFRIGQNGTPELLYDFTANVGDSWQFAPLDTNFGCPALPVATIVAKGNQFIAGGSVPYVDIEMPMDTIMLWGQPVYQVVSSHVLHERIYPDFGSTGFTTLFQPSPNTCDGTVFKATSLAYHQLRCFQNDSLNIKITSQTCDYWSLIGIGELDVSNELKLYPNPTNTGHIEIESTQQVLSVEIFDLTGKKLSEEKDVQHIYLPDSPGLYLIKLNLKDGSTHLEKVLRN